jgi:hypothetical protein
LIQHLEAKVMVKGGGVMLLDDEHIAYWRTQRVDITRDVFGGRLWGGFERALPVVVGSAHVWCQMPGEADVT